MLLSLQQQTASMYDDVVRSTVMQPNNNNNNNKCWVAVNLHTKLTTESANKGCYNLHSSLPYLAQR